MTDAPRIPSSPVPHSAGGGAPEDASAAVRGIGQVSALIEQAAHDLRSSLNAIQSWSYVLDRSIDSLAAPAQRALDGMRSGMQQQLALIEEMEEGVRLLADERAATWEETDLRVLAGLAIEDKRAAAEARGVILAALDTQDGGAGFVVPGDALRIGPLLRHLLVHCIWRAAAGGSVRVYLSAEPDYVKFRITESPPVERTRGESRLAALSDFFGRRAPPNGGHSPRQSTALLLTRRMVELQGAELTAENENCGDSENVTVCIAVRFLRAGSARSV
jgi:light-regulated signal transduction histidine kinase (bacteriophytochrome)